MSFGGIVLLSVLALIGILIVVGLFLYVKFKRTAKKLFGTSNIAALAKQGEFDALHSVKSINGMESLARPRIERDFPDLSIDELKSRDRDEIFAYYDALETGETSHYLTKKSLDDEITKMSKEFVQKGTNFSGITIHKHAISGYTKKQNMAIIHMQAAVEYRLAQTGEEEKRVQTRTKTEWVYLIEKSEFGAESATAALNCPNCGAPIAKVGAVGCEHCGSDLKIDYSRVWTLNAIKEF